MNDERIDDADDSSARRVFFLALTIGIAAAAMALALVAEHAVNADSPMDGFFWVELAAALIVIAAVVAGAPVALREMRSRHRAASRAHDARGEIEQLFQMTDMLQSALGYGDANAVLHSTASRLLPGLGVALYVFNNSGDRLDLSTAWDWPAERQPPATLSPAHCWALKRGKPHVNQIGSGMLRCEHQTPDIVVLEIPMMARGEIYGLLNVQASGETAEAQLAKVAPLATAIADAMSLALSNIALREKLRTQALRDPLTGLYNRRYMEDVLDRFASLAEWNGSGISAIMIDLDHFKRLNDEHGHAMGDAVLREAATGLVGAIRPCDVACRYGGEEFVILLPDCSLKDANAKAEILRARIESLSENHGIRITASFGVATMPESSEKTADLLLHADAALYQAKQAGRNRVASAPGRLGVHLSNLAG